MSVRLSTGICLFLDFLWKGIVDGIIEWKSYLVLDIIRNSCEK